MKTILVPLDGSALAEEVLPYVRMLAPVLGAEIRLLHVVSEIDTHNPLAYDITTLYSMGDVIAAQQERYQQSWQTMRQHAEGYLASQAMRLKEDGLDVAIDVRFGSPAEVIVEVAEKKHVALVTMATHGYSGLRRWALGSVTDRVVQAGPAPVFVVRGGAVDAANPPTLKHILVPLDGSELARQALPLAAELASCARAELLLLQAIAPPLDAHAGQRPLARPPMDMEESQAMLQEHATVEVGEQAQALRRRDLAVRTIVLNGHAAEVIVDEATREQADLIVMATHGRGGLRRWALGSVADKVLHATATPLVLVRAQESAT
ncbi:MAG: universal stress protein [Kouleothrix sp.]|nr:universal stress protein [Kouleothrix sp.]